MLTQEEYDVKVKARYDRLMKLSRKFQDQAGHLTATAKEMADQIPFGQPILVGHHSEKADRRYRGRIENKFRKGYELYKKAEYYAQRAASAKSNDAISSDDPGAIDKLKLKLARLQEWQERMKQANKYLRMKDQEKGNAGLIEIGFDPAEIRKPDVLGDVGFTRYALANNSGNMTRIKERIATLEYRRSQVTKELEVNGVRIIHNVDDNRIQVIFPSRIPLDLFREMKRNGFRYTPSLDKNGYQAFYNNWNKQRAQELAEKYQKG